MKAILRVAVLIQLADPCACVFAPRPLGPAERVVAAQGFEQIASCEVTDDRVFDRLVVDSATRFREIVLVVERGAVELRAVTVTFANGKVFAPPARTSYLADSTSAPIELPGGPRPIHDVIVDYGRRDDDARLELWAR